MNCNTVEYEVIAVQKSETALREQRFSQFASFDIQPRHRHGTGMLFKRTIQRRTYMATLCFRCAVQEIDMTIRLKITPSKDIVLNINCNNDKTSVATSGGNLF